MPNEQTPQERLRITFSKGDTLKYISHLDLARTWERVFRRAGLPVAYSQGFNPRPRFQIAAALPVGVRGRSEMLDVWLTESMAPSETMSRLRAALPSGLEVVGIEEVNLRSPSLQSQMRAAVYRAIVRSPEPSEAIGQRVSALLEAPTLPRRRQHKGRQQAYDLRRFIQSIEVEPGEEGEHVLMMRLQASPDGAGRPDEVLDVLGLSLAVYTVERTSLYFEFDK